MTITALPFCIDVELSSAVETPTVRLLLSIVARLPKPFVKLPSTTVRGRVIDAQRRQLERFKAEKKTYSNAQMAPKMIRKHCAITADGEKLLENAMTRLGLSARAHDRIL